MLSLTNFLIKICKILVGTYSISSEIKANQFSVQKFPNSISYRMYNFVFFIIHHISFLDIIFFYMISNEIIMEVISLPCLDNHRAIKFSMAFMHQCCHDDPKAYQGTYKSSQNTIANLLPRMIVQEMSANRNEWSNNKRAISEDCIES